MNVSTGGGGGAGDRPWREPKDDVVQIGGKRQRRRHSNAADEVSRLMMTSSL